MRFGVLGFAAAAAVATGLPVQAATIVQTTTESVLLLPILPFNASLGRLDTVTLDIDILKYRQWQVRAPLTTAGSVTVDWSVDGVWRSGLPGLLLDVPLTGVGTSVVTLESTLRGENRGDFFVTVTGHASVMLDPDYFKNEPRLFDGFDTGLYDPTGADTTLTADPDISFFRYSGDCRTGSGKGEDECGYARYRVTYDYTPAALLPVPEPATWGMMILGFGAVGTAMRRRQPYRGLATA